MIGAKLYERGASIGQVIAFLISSPWNSFSLTLILIALIGLEWTLLFIALSMLVAIAMGMIFEVLCNKRWIIDNPHYLDIPDNFRFWHTALNDCG